MGAVTHVLTRDYRFGIAKPGSPVRLEIFAAEQQPTSEFGCRVSVTGLPGRELDTVVYGIDSLQAVQLALQLAGSELYSCGEPPEDHVFWFEPGDELGIPVPPAITHLVEARTPIA